MKTLIIAIVLTVGGIKLGFSLFDNVVEQASNSKISHQIEERQAQLEAL